MSKTVIATDLDGNEHEVPIDELEWRPSAYAIVIKDGALLLSPQVNGYDLPGGGINRGELPEEAVIREVKEETGIDVANPRLVGCASNFFKRTYKTTHYIQSILLYYVCDFSGGELSDEGFTEEEKATSKFPEWVRLDKNRINLDDRQMGSSYDWRPLVEELVKKT